MHSPLEHVVSSSSWEPLQEKGRMCVLLDKSSRSAFFAEDTAPRPGRDELRSLQSLLRAS